MADTEKENSIGFVDKRRVAADSQRPGTTGDASYVDVGSLRTALAAAVPAYYTAARLNEMTKNDMVFALRTASDAAGI